MNRVFDLSSLLVMPFWLTMIFLPRLRFTEFMNRGYWGSIAAACLYAALIQQQFGPVLAAVLRPELPAIAALLGRAPGATLAWAHFLAFDLFVGRFIFWDARKRGISSWIVSPILCSTLMLGPLGLLSYLAVRQFSSRATATVAALS